MDSCEDETSPETLEKIGALFEKMNEAQENINIVSNGITEYDLQRNKMMEECRERLLTLSRRYGTRIEAVKKYLAAKEEVSQAIDALNAQTKLYKDKVLLRDAAKETLHLTEMRLKELQKEDPDGIKRNLTWLEQINTSTQKVQAAQKEVDFHWERHQAAHRICQEKEALMRVLERRNSRSIRMTKDYFTTRDYYQEKIDALLQARKEKMQELHHWREVYQSTLNEVGKLNREIHAGRAARKLLDDNMKNRPVNLGCEVMSIDSSYDLDPHVTSSGLNTPSRMSEDEWTDSDSVGGFSLDETNFRRRPGMIVNRTLHVEDHPLASR